MTPKGTNGDDITLRMVMEHMQHNFQFMRTQFTKIENRFSTLELRIDRLENKVDAGFADLQDRWRWLDSHDLPPRVSRLEDKIFTSIDP